MTDLTSIIRDAITAELERQRGAETSTELNFDYVDGEVFVKGMIDLTALSQAIARAVEKKP